MSGNRIETVRARALSKEHRALHALYCVGAVSVRVGSKSFFEFGKLVTQSLARPRVRYPVEGRTTYTLTDKGRETARSLFSLE